MVSDTQAQRLSFADATKLREDAGALLVRLIADREQSERRFAESGKRDPMKFVTGHTALDAAIASTRQMINHMDDLLVHLTGEREARPQLQIMHRHMARFNENGNGNGSAMSGGGIGLLATHSDASMA